MTTARTSTTRMHLLRCGRRLERVTRGASLLRRKREALARELFALARPAAGARTRIAEQSRAAYSALLDALAAQGRSGLRALAWPARDITVAIEPGSVWGVVVSEIADRPRLARTPAARGIAPGMAGPAAGRAMRAFEELAELLLDAAPREMLIRRLGGALAQTSRQVQTLERRVAPDLQGQIARIRSALDERERDARVQLRHLAHRRTR